MMAQTNTPDGNMAILLIKKFCNCKIDNALQDDRQYFV